MRGPTSTYLLDKAGVSWRYYVLEGEEPDWRGRRSHQVPKIKQNAFTRASGTPSQNSTDVNEDNQAGNIESLNGYYEAGA